MLPELDFPTDRHGLVRRKAALRNNISDGQLAAAISAGILIRLADGVFAVSSDELTDGDDGGDRLYRLRTIAVATSSKSTGPRVLSHWSAAALHGLPTLKPDHELVHFANGGTSGGFIRGRRHVHSAFVAPEQTMSIDDLALTTLERTAVDIALSGTFAQGVVVFDAALRLGADRDAMRKLLNGRRRRGVRGARQALSVADGRSESVGESWSRAQIIEAELPMPRLQHTFHVNGRDYRTDFDWAATLIGEFDGINKYGMRPGETAREALIREKKREADLALLPATLVRWTWGMLERDEMVPLVRTRLLDLGLMAA